MDPTHLNGHQPQPIILKHEEFETGEVGIVQLTQLGGGPPLGGVSDILTFPQPHPAGVPVADLVHAAQDPVSFATAGIPGFDFFPTPSPLVTSTTTTLPRDEFLPSTQHLPEIAPTGTTVFKSIVIGPTNDSPADRDSPLESSTISTSNLGEMTSDMVDIKTEATPPQELLTTAKGRKRASRSASCSSSSSSSTTSKKSAIGKKKRLSNDAKSARHKKLISPEELNQQRNQANIRERQRTQSLNDAFQNLRQRIPTLPSDKMSKIQTIKLAVDYIGFLFNVVNKDGEPGPGGHVNGAFEKQELSYAFNVWRMEDVMRNGSSKSPTKMQEN